MELSQSKIPDLMALLRGALGEAFFTASIDCYLPEDDSSLARLTSQKPPHPLAKWWKSLEGDLEKVRTTGIYYLSKESLLILWLAGNLNTLSHTENVSRLLSSLREAGTFFSTFFEVAVAASYVEMGFDLKVVNESTTSGVRTCDFIIRSGEEEVHVECKSLDDKMMKETPRWNLLCEQLIDRMLRNKRSWAIRVLADSELNEADTVAIKNVAYQDIRAGSLEQKRIKEHLAIEYTEIAPWDCPIEGNGIEVHRESSSIGMAKFEGYSDGEALTHIKNLMLVDGLPFVERDISSRLVANAKNANGQLGRERPGVIHIAVPYDVGDNFLDVIDESYWPLYAKIQKDCKRANAVVISAYVCQPNPEMPISFEHYIIPNNNPYNSLPTWFKVLGTMEFGFPIEAAQGTVVAELKPITPIPGVQLPLLGQVSRDGRYQLKAWLTWNGSLRIDFATPSFPRSFVQCPPGRYRLSDERNIFAFRWNGDEGMDLWLNGTEICSKAMTGKVPRSPQPPSSETFI